MLQQQQKQTAIPIEIPPMKPSTIPNEADKINPAEVIEQARREVDAQFNEKFNEISATNITNLNSIQRPGSGAILAHYRVLQNFEASEENLPSQKRVRYETANWYEFTAQHYFASENKDWQPQQVMKYTEKQPQISVLSPVPQAVVSPCSIRSSNRESYSIRVLHTEVYPYIVGEYMMQRRIFFCYDKATMLAALPEEKLAESSVESLVRKKIAATASLALNDPQLKAKATVGFVHIKPINVGVHRRMRTWQGQKVLPIIMELQKGRITQEDFHKQCLVVLKVEAED